jgi:(p)ppGpp synthase/HD superfamily hydrolase
MGNVRSAEYLDHMSENPAYSERFIAALSFAAELHQDQVRKGTTIPYVSHLMAVAAITLEAGGSETQAIAALLHDSVEDQGGLPTLEVIRAKFGDEVARIVGACSDAAPADGEVKAPWRERKLLHLHRLESEDPQVLLVTVADKIHNGEAILNDLKTHGQKVWNRFNADPMEILWYYSSTLNIAEKKLDNPFAVGRLRRLVEGMSNAVGDIVSA